VGHGWNAAAFWIATVYSIYAATTPAKFQARVLATFHIDPQQRLAFWGFGLAAFFLYAGYRAWSQENDRCEQLVVDNAAPSLPAFRWRITDSLLFPGDNNHVASIEKTRLYVKVTLWNSGPTSVIGEWSVRVDNRDFPSKTVFENDSDRSPSDPVVSGGRSTKEVYFTVAISPGRAFAKMGEDWKVSFGDASGNRYEFALGGLRIRI
jgi:hypothetical protein